MNRKSVAALVALGFVMGGASGAEAAFLPYTDYYAATISNYIGPPIIQTQALTEGSSENFPLNPFSQLELTLFGINDDTSVCARGFGCAFGYEVDTSKDYFVDIYDGKGGPDTTVTLSAGSAPIAFTEEIAPAPLPASAPMFGAALLGLGSLACYKRLRGAGSSVA